MKKTIFIILLTLLGLGSISAQDEGCFQLPYVITNPYCEELNEVFQYTQDRYQVENGKIFYHSDAPNNQYTVEVEGNLDPDDFQIIYAGAKTHAHHQSSLYAKSNNHLYMRRQIMDRVDVDIPSFEYACGPYFKDKDYVYNETFQKVTIDGVTLSPKGLECLNQYFFKDENIIFLRGLGIVDDVDFNSFVLINREYYSDKNGIYLKTNEGLTLLESIDLNTFEVLDGTSLVKDKNNVYIKENNKLTPIPQIDPKTFIVEATFMRDKDNIYQRNPKQTEYYNNIIIPLQGADPSSFKSLEHGFAKDKNSLYFRDGRGKEGYKEIEGSDPISFKYIDDRFYADKNNVYYVDFSEKLQIVDGADGNTREGFIKNEYRTNGSDYYKDKKRLFRGITPLEGIDPHTREVISRDWSRMGGAEYSKDHKNVYYHTGSETFKILEHADSKSIEMIGGYLLSNGSLYLQGIDIGISNVKDVEMIGDGYMKVNGKVYFGGMLVKNSEGFKKVDIDIMKIVDQKRKSEQTTNNEGVPIISLPWCLPETSGGGGGSFIPIFYTNKGGDIFLHGEQIPLFKNEEEILGGVNIDSVGNEVFYIKLAGCYGSRNYYFRQQRVDKIDIAIQEKIVPNLEKEKLEQTLQYLKVKSSGYRYGTMKEAIEGTFYRHILRNLDRYYDEQETL